ncbi:MAG: hypothetical protein KAT65_17830 [Methanophagales archaeon]|nr:hypothetical protein [Methanophagales archaeon]
MSAQLILSRGGDEMEVQANTVLKRIGNLEREIGYLKRDLMHLGGKTVQKPSLFGSVRGGDVTDEMIEEAKKNLFREAEDI